MQHNQVDSLTAISEVNLICFRSGPSHASQEKHTKTEYFCITGYSRHCSWHLQTSNCASEEQVLDALSLLN